MRERERFTGVGALIFGGVLVLVGGYYFLRNNLGFDLGPLDGELIWPAIVIIIGIVVVMRGLRPSATET
jgi:hypothetical protein